MSKKHKVEVIGKYSSGLMLGWALDEGWTIERTDIGQEIIVYVLTKEESEENPEEKS